MLLNLLGDLSSSTSILLYVCTTLSVIAFINWFWTSWKRPGPWGIPILGYYPFLRVDYYVHLHELAQKFGDPYFINLLGENFLYLDSAKSLKEVQVNQADIFPNRSNKHSILQYTFGNGVLFLEGDLWRVQRKFFVQTIRELGLGPKMDALSGPIGDGIYSLLDSLRESKGQLLHASDLATKECTTAILRLILGYSVTEECAAKVNEAFYKMLAPMGGMNFFLIGNIAKYLVLPRTKGYPDLIKGTAEMKRLLQDIVDDHKANFDPDQQPRDFIDYYLREQTLRTKKNDPQAKYFPDDVLVPNLIQAYGDGSVTVGVILGAFLKAISHHEEVQDAIYEEIVHAVGRERLPSWEDRNKLPFTNSTIKELFRTAKFFPVIPGLECIKETTVLGVRVPKGIPCIVNYWSIHNEPKDFKDPEKFDPTRFLEGQGKKIPQTYSFGTGRRGCAGESLVMTELFLFFAAILQNFSLRSEKEEESESKMEDVAVDEHNIKSWIRAYPRPEGRYS